MSDLLVLKSDLLNKCDQDKFIKAVESFGHVVDQGDNAWIIMGTDKSPTELGMYLSQFIHEHDILRVSQLVDDYIIDPSKH